MLIKLKRTRTHSEDRNLAIWLATAAGMLNAIALGAFGFFPSHMTGNTSQLSNELSNVDLRNMLFLGTTLLAFVGGAITARIAVISGLANGNRIIFCQVLLIEGVALVALSLFELFYYSPGNNREIIVLLGFLMGLHNSTSTQLSSGRVRSTHITGTLTDAGIALASLFAAMIRRDHSKEVVAQRKQFLTHIITILSFLLGGVAGLMLFNRFGFMAMCAIGALIICLSLASMITTVVRVNRIASPL